MSCYLKHLKIDQIFIPEKYIFKMLVILSSRVDGRWGIIKSPKQRLETYCFCSVSYYYFYFYFYFYYYYSYSFFPRSMNLSTADLRNYRTEFHETWWSYRYMFLVDPKVFRFVVKGVKAIFLGVQRGWGLL